MKENPSLINLEDTDNTQEIFNEGKLIYLGKSKSCPLEGVDGRPFVCEFNYRRLGLGAMDLEECAVCSNPKLEEKEACGDCENNQPHFEINNYYNVINNYAQPQDLDNDFYKKLRLKL
jgi:hypothetical protein